MKLLKKIQFTLLIIGTIYLTSCNDSVPIQDVKSTKTPTSVVKKNALSPIGDTVTLKNINDFSILIPQKATAQEKYSATMLSE